MHSFLAEGKGITLEDNLREAVVEWIYKWPRKTDLFICLLTVASGAPLSFLLAVFLVLFDSWLLFSLEKN